jgi:perosamine synthetase
MNKLERVPGSELAIYGGAPVRREPIETVVATSDEVRERVLDLLATGRLSNYYNGTWARRFEEAFARYHGPDRHAVAVNSGTSALHLAVTAAGIGPGDEVIVPALCFVAAATAVVQNGGVPVICDAEPDSLTIDVALAERLIGPRTKAILAVHFWGYPSDAARLRALCDNYGLILIEDCAQALGASAGGKKLGTYGDYATCAFSVRKHVACGEGGMVLCRREEDNDRVRRLSNYGKGPGWDDYDSLGYSYRLPEFSAIVALDGLSRLDHETHARRRAVALYRSLIENSGLVVVPEPPWGGSVYFKCPILLPPDMTGKRREIVDAIGAENVSCRIPHRPLFAIDWLAGYLQEKGAYRGAEQCPVAAAYHPRLIEIEAGPHLPIEEARLSGDALMKVWNHFRH